jgi:hypothetical protein
MADYRKIEGELDHGSSGERTPRWFQTYNSRGYPVGCGATAWAIVLGYWKQYKGKTNLLPGINMPYTQTSSHDADLGGEMAEIARSISTDYVDWQDEKYGRTWPSNMKDVDSYITAKGYDCSVDRIVGTEFNKCRQVKESLDQDRPVIILTNEAEHAFTSLHYPVIEKSTLKQKKVWGNWQDRDVYYSVNMGDGGPNKEIWVREYGVNDHPHTGSFSMFLLNIR